MGLGNLRGRVEEFCHRELLFSKGKLRIYVFNLSKSKTYSLKNRIHTRAYISIDRLDPWESAGAVVITTSKMAVMLH